MTALTAGPVVTLTPQQRAVVRELTRDGAGNATIAARLHISMGTVARHLSDALDATGCPSRTSLAVELLRGRLRIRTLDRRVDA